MEYLGYTKPDLEAPGICIRRISMSCTRQKDLIPCDHPDSATSATQVYPKRLFVILCIKFMT